MLTRLIRQSALRWFTAGLIVVQTVVPARLLADPSGGVVAAGSAAIHVMPGVVDVTQQSDRAVINWNTFSVGAGQAANFHLPGANSAVLNRVVTPGNISEIFGSINSNGHVFLINPAGIVVGPTGVINTGGFTASALDLPDADFMRGGALEFRGSGAGAILNYGQIHTGAGGATLVGGHVANYGTITSDGGTITLVVGDRLKLSATGKYIEADRATLVNGVSEYAPIIKNDGIIRATGAAKIGGEVYLVNPGGQVLQQGLIAAQKQTEAGQLAGGNVQVQADAVVNTGAIDASGSSGGRVDITADTVIQQGTITADADVAAAVDVPTGAPGAITVRYSGNYLDTLSSRLQARGGSVRVLGGEGTNAFVSGTFDASSLLGAGGSVALTGERIVLRGATLLAEGATAGGSVLVGGGFQGSDSSLFHARNVDIGSGVKISADALGSGNGGLAVVWSDDTTLFGGAISARGGDLSGDGGLMEVSGKNQLTFYGSADASAAVGLGGTLLLDPHTVTIDNVAGNALAFEFIDPNPKAGNAFGNVTTVLSTGNVVITAPNTDIGATADVGAAYLFNGSSGALISALVGSSASDAVGGGVRALTNGNYIVNSSTWSGNRGAATWGSGTTGVSGVVSATNSLVGSTVNDQVGSDITALTNGNYVVNSYFWSGSRGAVTWGSGTAGVSGVVSSANSLVGSTANDQVGSGGITALTNGNYVVRSVPWNGYMGAATWGSGTAGVSGVVSAANSLVGSTVNDLIGNYITTLANGNYLVGSYAWNGNMGAVTWGSGTAGVKGVVSSVNSLVGSTANDYVGGNGIATLSNGNYVVLSSDWNGGRGAATWGSATTGVSGVVSSTNSLIGSSANDRVGINGIYTFANGNYVVNSSNWNGNRGAATWGNGTTGVSGVISSANSLVGSSADDNVGYNGITVLTNDNYVVRSSYWNGTQGAATWGSGTAGVAGFVSSANSLVGSTASDYVGAGGAALTNGNYVVYSSAWNGNRGAATWGSGTTGVSGVVSSTNSLVGSTAGDNVSSGGITALTNGNYVVRSNNWNGTMGAVTWGSGTAGVTGVVSSANSLVGSTANDRVGSNGITTLSNGNYVVRSVNWNGSMGAVTWGSGTSGVSGTVSATNSLVGSTANDLVGSTAITTLSNGNYVVRSVSWNGNMGAVTWGSGTAGTAGVVSSANSLVGSTVNDQVGFGNIVMLTNGNYIVLSRNWNGSRGAATWGSGTTGVSGVVSSSNSLVGSTVNDQVGQSVTELTNGNYVVVSQNWNGNRGAATWGSGTAGISGVVSDLNSLVGSIANDAVGTTGITALTNGNYVVRSSSWNGNRGAATWGSGTLGVIGVVSATNSLVGSGGLDRIGLTAITALANGNYVVRSNTWSSNRGAVTWGSGTLGVTGVVSATNSLVGGAGSNGGGNVFLDSVNKTFIATFTTDTSGGFGGRVRVGSWDGPLGDAATFGTRPGLNVTIRPDLITAILNTGTAVVITANTDILVNQAIIASHATHAAGDLTLAAGRSILINANINTDGGNLSLSANRPAGDGTTGPLAAYRDAGTAVITMAPGTTINTGVGNFVARIDNGAGLSDSTAGDLTLNSLTVGGSLLIENRSASFGDVIIGTGGITLSGSLGATIRARGDIFLNGSMQNPGSGVVNILAGWDNVTNLLDPFDMLAVFDATTSYGNNSGSVFLNKSDGTGTVGVAVGSSFGATNVAAYNLNLRGGNASGDYAQLGYRAPASNDVAIDAPIQVQLRGSLAAQAGSADDTYIQIGHGGGASTSFTGHTYAGSIGLSAVGNVDLRGGSGARAYAQIGHGGYNADAALSGNLTIAGNASLSLNRGSDSTSYAQIGHGGSQVEGSATGQVTTYFQSNATLVGAQIGHFGTAGSFTRAGNTVIGVGQGTDKTGTLTADINSIFQSGTNGQLRLYMPHETSYQVAEGTSLNGAASAAPGTVLNKQGYYAFGLGAYAPTVPSTNYAVYLTKQFSIQVSGLGLSFYGSSVGTPTYGLVTGALDTGDALATIGLTHTAGTVVNAGTNAGDYGFSIGFGANGKYVVDPSSAGVWNVSPAPLTITANDLAKTYGSSVTFAGTEFTAAGLRNGNQITGVTLASTGAATGAAVLGGPYDITASAATGSNGYVAGNYALSYVAGKLTVNAAPLTITANDLAKTYGNSVTFAGTEFTVGAGQLKNGNQVTSVTLTSTGAASGTAVLGGPYDITASAATGVNGYAASNYALTYVAGKLTVNAAPLTITAGDLAKTYGNAVTFAGTEFTVGTGQLKNGNQVTSVTLASTGAATGAAVLGGPYDITASAATGSGGYVTSNYALTYVAGKLTVNAAPLTITANDLSKTYGDLITFGGTEFTVGAGQLKNGNQVTSVTLVSTGAATGAAVLGGPYDITASAATGTNGYVPSNYALTYVAGKLTVNAAPLTITANDLSKTYGNLTTFAGTEFTVGTGQLKNGNQVTSVTLTSTGAVTGAAVLGAPYDITASAATGSNGYVASNYALTYLAGKLTVNAAPLTITANDLSKTYGNAATFVGTEFTIGTGQLKNGNQVTGVTLTSTGAVTGAAVLGGPYDITASAATGSSGYVASNYALTYVAGKLTVNAAPLTITASDLFKTYGDLITFGGTEFTVGAGQLKNGNQVTSVTLASTGAATSASVLGGPYDITPSAATGTNGYVASNYALTYVAGKLTVNAAPLTITAGDLSKTYGDLTTFAGTEFTVGTGQLKNGNQITEVTLTSTGAVTGAAVLGGPYDITASAATGSGGYVASNYALTYVAGKLTVNAAPLTITASDLSKTYGNSVTFAGTEFTVGTGQLKNGNQVTGVTLTSTGAATGASVLGGPYDITAGAATGSNGYVASNYALSYVAGKLTVNAAPLTITANDLAKTYGNSVTFAGTEFTVGAGQLKNGNQVTGVTLTSTGAATGAAVLGGPYDITASAATGSNGYVASNYALTYVAGKLTVNAAPLTITASDLSKTYGNLTTFAGTEFTVGTGQLKNGNQVTSVTLTSTGAATGAAVLGAPYDITASAATGANGYVASNYALTYVAGKLTVNAAPLTITASDLSKTYGDLTTFAGTEFTVGAGQLKNGNQVTGVTLASTGAATGASVLAGPYDITAGAATGSSGYVASNYALTYVAGKLTVNAAPLTITANDLSKTYGDLITFGGTEFTVGAGQLKNGNQVTSVTLTSTGAATGAAVFGGPYDITASAATGSGGYVASNYALTYVAGTLTVNAAPLTITASDLAKTYGDLVTFAGAEFTVGAGQLKNGNQVTGVTLTSAGAATGAAVLGGPYDITPSAATGNGGYVASNYTLTYVAGKLTVNAAPLTITASDLSKTYGDLVTFAGTEFTVGAGQLKNGNQVTSVTLTSTGAATGATVLGGPYDITVSAATGSGGYVASNYALTYVAGKLTVNAAPLTITASDLAKTYGNAVSFAGTEFTVGAGQLKNGNQVTGVTLTSTGAATGASVLGGPYDIAASAATGASGYVASNYALTYVAGKLTVNAAPLTITANDLAKTYGDLVTFGGSEFTVGAGQLKNGNEVTSVTLTSTGAATGASVLGGPYDITASAATGANGFVTSNYALTYVAGKLTVNAAPLTITANDLAKTYGDLTTFAGTEFTAGAGQLKNGNQVTGVTLTSTGAATGAAVLGGPYDITASAATGANGFVTSNYALTYVAGKLTVNAASLTITANDLSKTYGDLTTFAGTEFTAGGLRNGDTIATVELSSLGAVADAAAGSYDISLARPTAGSIDFYNYAIILSPGTLTVVGFPAPPPALVGGGQYTDRGGRMPLRLESILPIGNAGFFDNRGVNFNRSGSRPGGRMAGESSFETFGEPSGGE